MAYEEPDIAKCFQLLDSSSSSPFRLDDGFGGGGDGLRSSGGGGRRVRGGEDFGAQPEDFLPPATGSARSAIMQDFGAQGVLDYDAAPQQPARPLPRVSLHPGHAPRRSPAIATLPYSAPRRIQEQNQFQAGPIQEEPAHYANVDDLGGPRPPAQAYQGRKAYVEDAFEADELDGVKEALAERDAALANPGMVDEPIVTPEVIAARSKTDFPAGLGQNSLVPITELDPAHESLFSFPTFNRMQSKVFADIYGSDENLVVTAPTSSGKTVIFELAYLRMRKESPGRLAIYMAPTKALCSERARDWKHRFSSVGTCVEITGDTNTVGLDRLLATADLLVITPEKLDVLSRRSAKYTSLDNLRLVMIDEVHILGESRGATLEVVMSRLKKRCTSYEPIRFVAVSATVPNIKDVAKWLAPPKAQITTGVFINGVNEETETAPVEERMQLTTMPEAKLWQFGDDFRPVPLSKIVNGYDGNDWTLGKKLDQELMPLIFEHGKGKPIMVFCPTRKSCQATAALLHDKYQELCKGASSSRRPLPWPRSHSAANFVDPQLQLWWSSGIAVHHAGIENTDRRAIEDGYRSGDISVICCTSTLAVGVNLPAHLVIIKGTQTWAGAANGMREYSDVDIQQMMGRAGRPQYDTSGTVIIMCEKSKVGMYRQKIFSKTVLESCLHTSLSEHINSEVGLGTITSLSGAQEWLEGSFLWIRIQQNPRAYTSIKKTMKGDNESWDKVLEKYVKLGLQQLRNIELVTHRGWNEEVKQAGTMADDDPMEELAHTALGKIMSECCIQLGTMESIVELGPTADLQDCLETLSGACEFEDLRVRQGEAGFLNQLRASPEIRFPLEDPVKTYADKVFLLLQGRFAAIEWDSVKTKTKTENSSAQQSLFAIYQHAPRIAQAIARVLTTRNFGSASKYGLQLLRIINGKAWEDQPSVFQQLRNIGPKSMRVLGTNNIMTWQDLLKTPPAQLEMWLARNPPFGSTLIREALAKDRYEVIIKQRMPATLDQDGFPHITFSINLKNEKKGGEEKDGAKWAKRSNLSILTIRSDGGWIDYRRALAKKMTKTEFELSTELTAADQTVEVNAGVDETSGLTTKAILEPDLSQLGDIDFEACQQRREARELQEAKERLLAEKEAEGQLIAERDLDAEELKKRDRTVRNRKVKPEDFRKEAIDEGGWTKSKAVPKRLNLSAAMAELSDAGGGGDESDEAMEDKAFDDGLGKERGGSRSTQQDGGIRQAQKVKSKRPQGVSQYIDDYAEESDDAEEEEESWRSKSTKSKSKKPSRSFFIDDEAAESSDGAIDELIDCTAPEYVPKPGSKRDLQLRGILPRKRRRADPDSADDEPPRPSRPREGKGRSSRSPLPRTAAKDVFASDEQPRSKPADTHTGAERQDSLEPFLPSTAAAQRSSSKPAPASTKPNEAVPPKHISSDPTELPDEWFLDEGNLSNFIIVPDTPVASTQNQPTKQSHISESHHGHYTPPNQSYPTPPQQAEHLQSRSSGSKGRVRFASQDDVQQLVGGQEGGTQEYDDNDAGYASPAYIQEGLEGSQMEDGGGTQGNYQGEMEYQHEYSQDIAEGQMGQGGGGGSGFQAEGGYADEGAYGESQGYQQQTSYGEEYDDGPSMTQPQYTGDYGYDQALPQDPPATGDYYTTQGDSYQGGNDQVYDEYQGENENMGFSATQPRRQLAAMPSSDSMAFDFDDFDSGNIGDMYDIRD